MDKQVWQSLTPPYLLHETEDLKLVRSPNVNYNFSKRNGVTHTWGKTPAEDITFSDIGPFIADIEVTTSCSGVRGVLCSSCYKSNTPAGTFMKIETFRNLLEKFPHVVDRDGKRHFVLQQIALGVDSKAESNPDLWQIMAHCRESGIIPNVTVADITPITASLISNFCGACAVSRYADKNVCYDIVKSLSQDYGMDQVNIHMIVADHTYDMIMETLEDIKKDPRLSKLRAIVFLQLKHKGRGVKQEVMSQEKFAKVIQKCVELGISYGSDSCGAAKLFNSLTDELKKKVEPLIMPCEAASESFYCNVEGRYAPCSFIEGEDLSIWKTGIDMLAVTDFFKEVWMRPEVVEFRAQVQAAIKQGKGCCHFNL